MDKLYAKELSKLKKLYSSLSYDKIEEIEHFLGLERIGYDYANGIPVYKKVREINKKIKAKTTFTKRDLYPVEREFLNKQVYINDIKIAFYLNLLPVIEQDTLKMAPEFELEEEQIDNKKGIILVEQYSTSESEIEFMLFVNFSKNDFYITEIKKPFKLKTKATPTTPDVLFGKFCNKTGKEISIPFKMYHDNLGKITKGTRTIKPGEYFFAPIKDISSQLIVPFGCVYSKTKSIRDIPGQERIFNLGYLIKEPTLTLINIIRDEEGNTKKCVFIDNMTGNHVSLEKELLMKNKDTLSFTNMKIIENRIEILNGNINDFYQ